MFEAYSLKYISKACARARSIQAWVRSLRAPNGRLCASATRSCASFDSLSWPVSALHGPMYPFFQGSFWSVLPRQKPMWIVMPLQDISDVQYCIVILCFRPFSAILCLADPVLLLFISSKCLWHYYSHSLRMCLSWEYLWHCYSFEMSVMESAHSGLCLCLKGCLQSFIWGTLLDDCACQYYPLHVVFLKFQWRSQCNFALQNAGYDVNWSAFVLHCSWLG